MPFAGARPNRRQAVCPDAAPTRPSPPWRWPALPWRAAAAATAEPPPVPAAPRPRQQPRHHAADGDDRERRLHARGHGPVTFTFVFSGDVGISFDGTDVTVGGGTPGTFARERHQATLVVTPTPAVGGTITVDVPAKVYRPGGQRQHGGHASASMPYLATQTITFASPGNQTLGTAARAVGHRHFGPAGDDRLDRLRSAR